METVRELQLYEGALPPLSPIIVRQQINLIQEVMRDAMKEGEHFGKIPGCGPKPALLKPGAEKLILTFRMAPKYEIIGRDLGNGHREFEIICSLYSIGSEKFLGQGVGSCSSMETKYRYRNVADYEITDTPIPKDAKEKKTEYRRQGFGMKKVEDDWVWVKYKDTAKTENPDIADTYNTVLKMAKKRALVDAVLTVTAASDIFTQDIEDMADMAIDIQPIAPSPDKSPKKSDLTSRKEAAVKWLAEKGVGVDLAQNYLKKNYKDWDETDLNALKDWAKTGFGKEESFEESQEPEKKKPGRPSKTPDKAPESPVVEPKVDPEPSVQEPGESPTTVPTDPLGNITDEQISELTRVPNEILKAGYQFCGINPVARLKDINFDTAENLLEYVRKQ